MLPVWLDKVMKISNEYKYPISRTDEPRQWQRVLGGLRGIPVVVILTYYALHGRI